MRWVKKIIRECVFVTHINPCLFFYLKIVCIGARKKKREWHTVMGTITVFLT